MILTAANKQLCLFLIGSFVFCLPAAAYDETEAQKVSDDIKKYGFETVTTKEGLTFRIPKDMPIERKDGLVQPVDYNEYLYIKFKKIEDKSTDLEKKAASLDEAVKVLAKQNDKIISILEKMNQDIAKLETAQSEKTASAPETAPSA